MCAGIGGHETNGHLAVERPNAVQSLWPIEARHLHVEQNDVDLLAVIAAMIERRLAAGRGPHAVAVVFQIELQQVANGRFVIDDENAGAFTAQPVKNFGSSAPRHDAWSSKADSENGFVKVRSPAARPGR